MFCWILVMCVLAIRAETNGTTTVVPTTGTSTTSTGTVAASDPSTASTASIRVVPGLTGLHHGVKSDDITIIGDSTFQIPNFHFDGTAPQAFFLVGTGPINGKGTFVYLDSSKEPLKQYTGETVKLTLSDGLTVHDIDWLAVWCVKFRQNLGYVTLKSTPPQTFGLRDQVTSNSIVLEDKKTLFIPSLRYNGDHKNVRFWVGNGTEPTSEGVPIPDETGSTENLKSYHGVDIHLKLPEGVSTDNIDYFGVWSVDEGVSLGYVPIRGIEGVPEVAPRQTSADLFIPKCCPEDSILTPNGCETTDRKIAFQFKFKVYEHNETHFSNDSLDVSKIAFTPYNSVPSCDSGKYPLDPEFEEFALLQNGSLLVKGALVKGVLSTDQFCLENIQDDNSSNFEMKILVCTPERKIQKAMFITYVTFTIISTFCFAITFFLYTFWLKIEDVHRKFFTGYVFCMMVTFLSLTVVQTAKVENSGCEVLGFFFQIAMIASFTLLGILCFDIWIIIKYIDEDMLRRKRRRWYMAIALAVPLISLIISLSRNLVPDVPNSFFKPQYMNNLCNFDSESQRTILFYVPIALSIVTSAAFLLLTKLQIVDNDKNRPNDYFWIEKGTVYKFMWRKHLIIFLTSLMWAVETVLHMFFAESSMLAAVDVIEASQGILVLLLFVLNKETRTQIVKRIKVGRRMMKQQNYIFEEGSDDIMLNSR